MKTNVTILLFLLLFSSRFVIGQSENSSNSPFTFEGKYVGDVFYNFGGGIGKGGTYLGMASFIIGFNTEDAKLWKGGEFYLNGANTHGGEPSAEFIGDYQVASNIEAGDLTYLHELWFKQSLGKFAVVLGLQDLCAEFISSDFASLYLNSSCGVHSTIANNLAVPIFPLTALGAQFHYKITDKFTFKIALFDGVPDDPSMNKHNINWKLKKEDGYLFFSQISYRNKSEKYPGNYKLGFYYHNPYSIANELDGGAIEIKKHSENYGFYFILDQTLYQNENGKTLTVFTQTSISPKKINENWYFFGVGLNYKGFLKQRIDDEAGIALSHAVINNSIGNESTIELTYKAILGNHFFIQPDFQYIINPAGTEKELENCLVGFLRIGLQF